MLGAPGKYDVDSVCDLGRGTASRFVDQHGAVDWGPVCKCDALVLFCHQSKCEPGGCVGSSIAEHSCSSHLDIKYPVWSPGTQLGLKNSHGFF